MSIVYPDCKKADGTAATKPAPIYYTYDTDYNLKTETRLKDVYNPTTSLDESRNVVTTYNYNSTTGNPESIIVDDGDPALGCKKLTTNIAYEPEHNGVLTIFIHDRRHGQYHDLYQYL